MLRDMRVVEVSEGESINNWSRDDSCDILANNMAAFCLCSKNLSEAKLISNGQIFLVGEISR